MSSIQEIENQWNIYKTRHDHQSLEEWLENYDWAIITEDPDFKSKNYIVKGEVITRLRFLVIKHIIDELID